jgi:hypothetical protein
MRYGVRRLVNGLARDLFREDAAAYYRDLLAYAAPELETLETAVTWVDHFASDAVSARGLIDELDPAVLAKVFGDKILSQNPIDQSASTSLKRVRAKSTAARLRETRLQKRRLKTGRRAK